MILTFMLEPLRQHPNLYAYAHTPFFKILHATCIKMNLSVYYQQISSEFWAKKHA